jgi:hypothetical protein
VHLATGWGEGVITQLKLEYLYGPEPEAVVDATDQMTRFKRLMKRSGD